jgi:hypothetical protein
MMNLKRLPRMMILTAVGFACLASWSQVEGAQYKTTRSGSWTDLGATTTPWAGSPTVYPGQPQVIVSCTNNGSGGIRILVAGTPTPGWVVGDKVVVSGVKGTIEANSPAHTAWTVSQVSGAYGGRYTQLDLANSVFTRAFVPSAMGVAVRGDTVFVNTNHVVTVTGSQSVGGFTSNGYGLWVDSDTQTKSGSLVIAPNAKLILRTGLYLGGALTMGAGSSLTVDNCAGQAYFLRMAAKTTSVFAEGTASSPVTLTGYNAPFNGWAGGFTSANTPKSLTFRYCNFTGFQSALLLNGGEPYVEISNCVLTRNRAQFVQNGPHASGNVLLLQNTRFEQTFNGNSASLKTNGANPTPGVGSRVIDGCSFDSKVEFNSGADGYVITRSYFTTIVQNAAGQWATFDQNIFAQMSVKATMVQAGPITNCIFTTDDDSHTDPNVVKVTAFSGPSPTLTGCIYQSNALDNNAAFYFSEFNAAPPTLINITASNNLVLPSLNPLAPGTSGSLFIFGNTVPGITAALDHNTSVVDTGKSYVGMVYLGDLSTDVPTGSITSLRSNLAYGATAAPSLSSASSNNLLLKLSDTVVSLDAVTPSVSGYNGGFNLTPSSTQANTTKPGYRTKGTSLFSTVPLADTTDVSGDPAFQDSTRDLATAYTNYLGNTSTGTRVGDYRATVALLALNPTKVDGVRRWIRTGWMPTNAVYQNAGHDGENIGLTAP